MFDFRLKMCKGAGLRRSCARFISSIFNRTSHIHSSTSHVHTSTSHVQRSAMTLVELLVVIVILTTLVAGVIPVLSPNNDVRKIRAAARGLQSYITMVQAQAARTGRPQGIAFRESFPESGVALEVFGWEVPPPFAGFSTESRVRVERVDAVHPTSTELTYSGTHFSPEYFGFDLYRVRFELADGTTVLPAYTADQLPPRTFQVGDVLAVEGNQFLVVDDSQARNFVEQFLPAPTYYLNPQGNTDPLFADSVICVWINNSGQTLAPGLKRYQINRQPATSSESPYQLPSGIVIDMQASVAEGATMPVNVFPMPSSFFFFSPGRTTEDTVGIMFSPTGAVDSVIFNGNELTSVSRIVLLLGRIENGELEPVVYSSGNRNTAPWTIQAGENFEDVQERINWLNLDSRLLSIVTNSGRAVVSEAAFVDAAAMTTPSGETDLDTAEEQIEALHEFAHEMTTAK